MPRENIGNEQEERTDGRYIQLGAMKLEESMIYVFLRGITTPEHHIGKARNFERTETGELSMEIELEEKYQGLNLNYGMYATDLEGRCDVDGVHIVTNGKIRYISAVINPGFPEGMI